MPPRADFSKMNCSLARALEIAGDGWTMLILRDAFIGATRFVDFTKSLGIARNILSARLESLVAAGVMDREGTEHRPRYRLTRKGRELFPVLVAFAQWGDTWLSDDKPPIQFEGPDGEALAQLEVRSQSGRTLSSEDVRFSPGPGADDRTKLFLKAMSGGRS
jgi:DNA-binding HxlR family transcriptional regulator